MKSMPARVKIQAVEAKAEDPPAFSGGYKKLPAGVGVPQTHPKAGENLPTQHSSTEKLLVGVDGCKSGKKQLRLVVYPIGFRVFVRFLAG